MKVEAIRFFEDLEAKTDRRPGEVWEVDEERFNALNSTPSGQFVKAVEEPAKRAPKPAKKQEA